MAKILKVVETKPLGYAGLNPSKTRRIHFYESGTLEDALVTLESGLGWWKPHKPQRAAQVIREVLLPVVESSEMVRLEVVPGTGSGDGSFTIVFNYDLPRLLGSKDGYKYSVLGSEFTVSY